jgi:chitinase
MAVIDDNLAQGSGPTLPVPNEPPPPRLSPVRVVVLLVVLAALGLGGWRLISNDSSAASAKSEAAPVYSPYVDVTQTPTYPFQLPAANPVSSVYLSFIVSDSSDPCTPSWGTYYTLDQAAQGLDLDARTAQLRQQGGSVSVSFGGQANTEIAVGCTDPGKLVDAYTASIQRYHATTVDFDLEGESLADAAANARRASAVATIQRRMAASETPLKVWLTLPVSSNGLTAEGVAAVKSMLDAEVDLAGVNAMTMDFGPGEGAAHDMVGTIEQALTGTQLQVQALWREAGLPSSAGAAWGHVGVTPMIGVNDIAGQRLTTADAREVAAFVNRRGIPRVSAWSLNRDSECGGAFARTGVVSNTCSGVVQEPLEFTHIFSELRGTKTARKEDPGAAPEPQRIAKTPTDDPATSPYPIWRPTAAYGSGYKVVWQGQIYQASWWNQGTVPGSAAAASPTGPWQPIGPVPAGSRAPKLVPLVKGSFRQWSPTTVYQGGDRVDFKGMPYQARWYTRGEQPLEELPSDPSQPWEPLFKYPGEPTDLTSETGAK